MTRSTRRCWAASNRRTSRCPRRAVGTSTIRAPRRANNIPIQCRRKGTMEAPEEVLLDLNELGKDKKFVGLGSFVVSDDQNLAGIQPSTTPASVSTLCT